MLVTNLLVGMFNCKKNCSKNLIVLESQTKKHPLLSALYYPSSGIATISLKLLASCIIVLTYLIIYLVVGERNRRDF